MALVQQVDKVFSYTKLINLESIKDNIQISKVLLYLEKCNITIPKTTVQNYVKEGVISPLFEGRYYNKRNILELYFAIYLREFFTLKEILLINNKIFSLSDSYLDIYNTFLYVFENYDKLENKSTYDTDLESLFFEIVSLKIKKENILKFLNNI